MHVEISHGERKLGKELERANKLGVQYAVILGADELARGDVLLKDMTAGHQRAVPLTKLEQELLSLRARA
jgi:histidyl-tRNA synthetase